MVGSQWLCQYDLTYRLWRAPWVKKCVLCMVSCISDLHRKSYVKEAPARFFNLIARLLLRFMASFFLGSVLIIGSLPRTRIVRRWDLACLGLCCHWLACFGLCLPALFRVGPPWPVLAWTACAGLCWAVLACLGLC